MSDINCPMEEGFDENRNITEACMNCPTPDRYCSSRRIDQLDMMVNLLAALLSGDAPAPEHDGWTAVDWRRYALDVLPPWVKWPPMTPEGGAE